MRVLNFGSLNLDYVYQVERFVRPGETMSASRHEIKAGGKGLNQSVALARAGARVWHAGCVGLGGDRLRALLRENGVEDAYLRSVDVLQGNAVIQVNAAGENCILLYGGSNRCLTEAQIGETISAFSAEDWLVLQNEVNLVPRIAERARERGLRIALNPSPYNEGLRGLDYGQIDWLLVNEVEAGQMTGSAGPERAWEWLHARYPRLSLLVTLGGRGSMAWRAGDGAAEACRQDAFAVKAVDTTGAGDTYTGYFIGALAAGMPLGQCMRRASAAAAIAVTRHGAAASIPLAGEVDALLRDGFLPSP